jgi:alpha-glucosidase
MSSTEIELASHAAPRRWWQDAVIYQIYVRSFQDSDGDGVGDLPGIARRLDHLAWLGVDAIWLTPFYRSPMQDFGYDVTDHRDVDPAFGTLADFDALVEEAHRRHIRLIVDFIPNHTSHLHPWFQESRSSRDSPRRDWYIWADGRGDGRPPNNWRGQGPRDFEGGGWAWDEQTEQWYLANFSPAQPELNWANPDVRRAMLDILDFWLSRGADGARVDMIDFLGKDPELRDEPPDVASRAPRDYFAGARHQINRPETLDYIGAMRRTMERHPDCVLVGEVIYFLPLERFGAYYGDGRGVDLPSNFRLTFLPLDATVLRTWLSEYDDTMRHLGCWPNHCVGNHDAPRAASGGEDAGRLKMLLLLTLRGTPFIYYGDELGIPDVSIPDERRQDALWVHPDTGGGRDGARTPMAWTVGPGHGFTAPDVEPWLPFHEDAEQRNATTLRDDEHSILTLTHRLLRLRRTSSALRDGSFTALDSLPDDCLAYRRDSEDESLVVVLNLGTRPVRLDGLARAGQVLLSTGLDRDGERVRAPLEVRAREGLLLRLDEGGQP